jgi:hypothetical protein
MGNFRKEIDFCAAETAYDPSNNRLKVAELETQHAAALAAVEDVDAKNAPHMVDRNARRAAYDAVPKLFRRSRNLLKSTGASVAFLDDAENLIRKITGKRKTPKVKDDPSTPGNEAAQQHSAAQMSYESILGNCRAYVELITNEPLYVTTDADLKIGNLTSVCDDLEAKNNAVSASFPPVSQARGSRDDLLFDNADCVVNTALLVKDYTKSLSDDTLYKAIKGLSFPRQRR